MPQTQGYDEVIQEDEHQWRHFKSGTFMLFVIFPLLCDCEYRVIRALWITPARDYGASEHFVLPIFIALPFVMAAWSTRSVIRIFRAGEMKRKTAELVASIISVLGILTYFAISELIKIAF